MAGHARVAAAYAILVAAAENSDAALAERDWQVNQLDSKKHRTRRTSGLKSKKRSS
jgi:hypothetical protein